MNSNGTDGMCIPVGEATAAGIEVESMPSDIGEALKATGSGLGRAAWNLCWGGVSGLDLFGVLSSSDLAEGGSLFLDAMGGVGEVVGMPESPPTGVTLVSSRTMLGN